ncbi:NlpC/P60 family protein [Mariniphaga anaerophila]|uniref:NlpC/P60 family protein n=1 Tax=Mariniphaga anaerophila TaxID=1484053 RepID=A0A1M4WCG5_9BACT|nr:C40 family peptidase [Mariniphaga anaerophila]SHE78840.1 NlpC/P60 family protein [Mariniphaga anaerophila]
MSQRSKNIVILLLTSLFFIFACNVNNRKKAEKIIEDFEQAFVPDKRETVFEIEAVFKNGQIAVTGETDSQELKNNLLQKLHSLEILDKIVVLPDSTVGNKIFGLVNNSVANLRTDPRYSSELSTQALLGTPVKILKKKGSWSLVQTPDKYISWAPPGAVFPISESSLKKWRDTERVILKTSFTEIFETEKMEIPIADASMGGIVELLEEKWNTLKVKLPDGREGYTTPDNWISFSDFLTTAHPNSASIVSLSQKLTGRPYLWGGTSALAMDCSGFTKTVYFMHGIILARDASLQARHGQMAEPGNSFEKLAPGDLLFFGRKATDNQPERITHVAISLGETEFIHASAHVRKNSFNPPSSLFSEYRKNTFIRARRVIGSEGENGIRWIKEHPWY